MKNELVCGIYKITSPVGRIYIGQSRNCEKREKKYKSLDCKKQQRVYHSVIKYGWENHSFEVIHLCEIVELDYWENYYIELYDSFDTEHGLNLIKGTAANGKRSKETKERNREASKLAYAEGRKERPIGSKNGMYGNGHKLAGEKNGRFGQLVPPETIERLRAGLLAHYKKYGGRKFSEEDKLKAATIKLKAFGKDGTKGRYYGVYVPAGSKKFYSYIKVNGKRTYNGNYLTEDAAALAFNTAQLKHWGKIIFHNNVVPARHCSPIQTALW